MVTKPLLKKYPCDTTIPALPYLDLTPNGGDLLVESSFTYCTAKSVRRYFKQNTLNQTVPLKKDLTKS